MVHVITIRNLKDAIYASNSLKRMNKTLPLMTSKVMMKFGLKLEENIKYSAEHFGKIKRFKGLLFDKGINWRQRPKGKIGRLFMRLYGIQLDSMKPHWVNFHKRRKTLLSWARQAQSGAIRDSAMAIDAKQRTKGKVFVRPHPFIENGWRMTRPLLKTYLKHELKNLLRKQVRT